MPWYKPIRFPLFGCQCVLDLDPGLYTLWIPEWSGRYLVGWKIWPGLSGDGRSILVHLSRRGLIGGASILGGSGSYIGTIGGAMLLAVLFSLLPVLNMPRPYQLIIYGLVVLLAVFFSTSRFGSQKT